MTSNALATRRQDDLMPDPAAWQTMLHMAKELVDSGMLPATIKTPQAAVAIIQKGRELGIPPMHALSSIVVIQGKPTCSAELMAALVYRDHGDDALVFTEATATRCTISYKRRNWSARQAYAFTMEDARQAGLQGGNWQKYPAAMLRARAISAVARMAFPDTIGGMYTHEEVGGAVTVDTTGEIVPIPETLPRDDDAPIRSAVDVLTAELDEPATDDALPMWSEEDIHDWLDQVADRKELPVVREAINTAGLGDNPLVMSHYTRVWEQVTGKRAPTSQDQPALTGVN